MAASSLLTGQAGCRSRNPMDTFLKTLDLQSWDVWFPLSLVALFGGLAIAVAVGGVGFGINAQDAEQR